MNPTPTQPPANDMERLMLLRHELKRCTDSRKALKEEYEPMEQRAVQMMLMEKKRFIQRTPDSYITLAKNENAGTFNQERQWKFFEMLIPAITGGQIRDAEACMKHLNTYLKQFNKRKLVLEETSKQPPRTMDDLLQFLSSTEPHS